MRESIGGAKVVARREEEEGSAGAVRDAELAQRFRHRLHAVMVGRNRQHPERLPSELPLVLFCGMRRQVRAHFFFEACLPKGIRPHHRHGAAVDLDHEMTAGDIGKHEPERKIRDKSHFVRDAPMRERDAQRKWIAGGNALIREGSDHLVGVDELHVGASARRA